MQMKKYHWKRRRDVTPCQVCGKDHATKLCASRTGKRKPKPLRPRTEAR